MTDLRKMADGVYTNTFTLTHATHTCHTHTQTHTISHENMLTAYIFLPPPPLLPHPSTLWMVCTAEWTDTDRPHYHNH